MAKARVIIERRKTAGNIRKITRTMQLIATSKFQRAHNRVVASRPYAENIFRLVGDLSAAAEGRFSHPLLEQRQAPVSVLLVVTSNRGLCGGYNAALLRTALAHCQAERSAGRTVRLDVLGRKGLLQLKFLGLPIETSDTDIIEKPTFDKLRSLAERYIGMFSNQPDIHSIHVACTRFLSAGVQRPAIVQLLPLGESSVGEEGKRQPATGADSKGASAPSAGASSSSLPLPPGEGRGEGISTKSSAPVFEHYDFSPDAPSLLAELLPAAVRARLMQCVLEATLSEQVARMTAMKAATENAEEMIARLTQQYNRARQGQITKEISEIIGGAEALK